VKTESAQRQVEDRSFSPKSHRDTMFSLSGEKEGGVYIRHTKVANIIRKTKETKAEGN
jgi:hypothetical protein